MSSTSSPTDASTRFTPRLMVVLSWINLLALAVVAWLLFVVSESWWVGTVLTYAPLTPFVAPTLGLLVASFFWHRPSLFLNTVSLALVAGPVMGLSFPILRLTGIVPVRADGYELKLVSCNVQAFRPDFSMLLHEIAVIDPDVIALQEAFPLSPLVTTAFPEWYTVQQDRYWVGSRYPLRLITTCQAAIFNRIAGVAVEIQTPAGSVILGNIHQMTPRRGLVKLSLRSVFEDDGPRRLEKLGRQRAEESLAIRTWMESARGNRPLLICGDFNTPVSSQLFRSHWSEFQSAFDIAGIGFGYTAPCQPSQYWPENLPWARIDHILCSAEWSVQSCQVGHSAGSDHRLIAATLRLSESAVDLATTSAIGSR